MRIRNTLCFTLMLLFSNASRVVAQQPESQQQPPPTASSSSATKKAQQVWTNDNISSLSSVVSGIGTSSTTGSGQRSHSGAYSNGGRIVSPADGSVVRPGETLHIEAELDAGTEPGSAAIISEIGQSNESRESSPYSFTFNIPSDAAPGPHLLTLFVGGSNRKDYNLAGVTVDVEELDAPVSLEIETQFSPAPRPLHLDFLGLGQDEEIAVLAVFPNGRSIDVTRSTYTGLSSSNPAVARVSDDGIITSFGPGEATVVISYTRGAESVQATVPVHVSGTNAGALVADPPSIDFGTQAVGSTSTARTVVLTNHANSAIKLFDFVGYGFVVNAGNCANTTLAVSASCSFTVAFHPYSDRNVHENLNIQNSFDQFAIPLSGNGN